MSETQPGPGCVVGGSALRGLGPAVVIARACLQCAVSSGYLLLEPLCLQVFVKNVFNTFVLTVSRVVYYKKLCFYPAPPENEHDPLSQNSKPPCARDP